MRRGARAKGVDPRLRVGGPATAQAAWVDRLIAALRAERTCRSISYRHMFTATTARRMFSARTRNQPARHGGAPARKFRSGETLGDAGPADLLRKYNASYANEPAVRDGAFMGPWLANNIRHADGLTTRCLIGPSRMSSKRRRGEEAVLWGLRLVRGERNPEGYCIANPGQS